MITKESPIFITGATGFLGSYIARRFHHSGYKNLKLLHRKTSSLDLIKDIKDKVTLVEGDILDHPNLLLQTQGQELVIHAAAMVSLSGKDEQKMHRINIDGTKNIVNCCLENKVKRLLHVSSVAALGKGVQEEIIDESRDWIVDKYNSSYAISKYESEMEVWRGQEEGLEVSIINPGVVIGAGKWSDSSLMMMSTISKGVSFYPLGSNGMVDVRDVAEMCEKMISKNIIAKRIIAVSDQVNLKQLTTTIARATNSKEPHIAVKPSYIPLIWRLFKVKKWITGRDSGITRAMLMNTSKNWTYDNTLSREILDFEYRDINTSIVEMCNAFLNSQKACQKYSIYPLENNSI